MCDDENTNRITPTLPSVKSSNPSLNKEIHEPLLIYLPPPHSEPDKPPSHSLKPDLILHSYANCKPISDEPWKTPPFSPQHTETRTARIVYSLEYPKRRTFVSPIRKRKQGHRTSGDLDPRRKSNCSPRAEVGVRLGHRVCRKRARLSACAILDMYIPSPSSFCLVRIAQELLRSPDLRSVGSEVSWLGCEWR